MTHIKCQRSLNHVVIYYSIQCFPLHTKHIFPNVKPHTEPQLCKSKHRTSDILDFVYKYHYLRTMGMNNTKHCKENLSYSAAW